MKISNFFSKKEPIVIIDYIYVPTVYQSRCCGQDVRQLAWQLVADLSFPIKEEEILRRNTFICNGCGQKKFRVFLIKK
ncbi:MAG: hypothetical protein RL687_105 [Candidatus Parcubacteria bacterium]